MGYSLNRVRYLLCFLSLHLVGVLTLLAAGTPAQKIFSEHHLVEGLTAFYYFVALIAFSVAARKNSTARRRLLFFAALCGVCFIEEIAILKYVRSNLEALEVQPIDAFHDFISIAIMDLAGSNPGIVAVAVALFAIAGQILIDTLKRVFGLQALAISAFYLLLVAQVIDLSFTRVPLLDFTEEFLEMAAALAFMLLSLEDWKSAKMQTAASSKEETAV